MYLEESLQVNLPVIVFNKTVFRTLFLLCALRIWLKEYGRKWKRIKLFVHHTLKNSCKKYSLFPIAQNLFRNTNCSGDHNSKLRCLIFSTSFE